jgi:hypothetical protein
VIARRALAALLVWGGIAHAQQRTIRVVDLGLGPGPRILQRALAGPHVLVLPSRERAVLPRDSTYRTTVIVLGREAAVEGTVTGDLIVLGGDLHVHPHATVNGRAVAIGGAVYESAMATVGGGSLSFRDFTYDVVEAPGGFELRYRSLTNRPARAFTLPGAYGFRVPAYDRTNGLSVSLSPLIAVPRTQLLIDPGVTYRSQLGEFDPAGGVKLFVNSRTTLHAGVERGTFTNDAWICPDLLNSAATLVLGDDGRNYYRGTRANASGSYQWEWPGTTLTTTVGALWERAESVRPDTSAAGGPWSIHGQRDRLHMLRPNPPVDSGTIISGLIGARLGLSGGGITTRVALDVEAGGFNPAFGSASGASRSFVQATFDGTIIFPTFGTQSLRFDGHVIASATGRLPADRVMTVDASVPASAPRQRWAYIGGWSSIPTLDLLSRGGDELVYLDGRYSIPLDRLQLPVVGAPVVTLRNVLGGADVERWPSLAQATGVRLSLAAVYAEYLIDPANRRQFLGVGLSMAR